MQNNNYLAIWNMWKMSLNTSISRLAYHGDSLLEHLKHVNFCKSVSSTTFLTINW